MEVVGVHEATDLEFLDGDFVVGGGGENAGIDEDAFMNPEHLLNLHAYSFHCLLVLTLQACSKHLPEKFKFIIGAIYTLDVRNVVYVYRAISDDQRFFELFDLEAIKQPRFIKMRENVRAMKCVYIDDNMELLLRSMKTFVDINNPLCYFKSNRVMIRFALL